MATRQFVHITLGFLLMFNSISFLNAPVFYERLPEAPEKIQKKSFMGQYGLRITALLGTLATAVALYFHNQSEESIGFEPAIRPVRRKPMRQIVDTEAAFKAAQEGDPALERWISGGLNPNLTDSRNNTLLMMAARHGHGYTVDFLLQQPGILIDAQNDEGNTALMLAAHAGKINIVTTLLRHANKHIKNNHDQTAWDMAKHHPRIQGYIERSE